MTKKYAMAETNNANIPTDAVSLAKQVTTLLVVSASHGTFLGYLGNRRATASSPASPRGTGRGYKYPEYYFCLHTPTGAQSWKC